MAQTFNKIHFLFKDYFMRVLYRKKANRKTYEKMDRHYNDAIALMA